MQTKEWQEVVVVENGSVTTPKGFKAGGVHCGIKRKKLDLGFIYSETPATTVGVYTTNIFQAAPLVVTQESIAKEHVAQAILVNSGNANSCTGEQGIKDAYSMQTMFAKKLNIPNHYVAVTSTGVIGEQLPIEKIQAGIEVVLLPENEGVSHFEHAILTTDTKIKNCCVQIEIGGKVVTIGGAAKGSGMIHPNMATMLGFITTDASIDYEDLHDALKEVTNETFNMITVDGDTSTNDMVLVMANGMANNEKLTKGHHDWPSFIRGLKHVSESLAKQIARDGEGATKLVEVHVKGAIDLETARVISKTIISSNLVKTAIYGADANWGRIICSIGYSGQAINPNFVKVSIGPIPVVDGGLPCPFDEDEATAYLQNEVVQIFVDLRQGDAEATAWGCDLTYDYVKINASYRT